MAETININTYPIEETIAVTTVEDVTTVNVNIIQSTGAVTSVNEQTGDVVLTPSNIGALAVDGSNASSNIGLGAYSLSASELAGGVVQALGGNDNLQLKNGSVESGEVGMYSANADQKIATYVHVDSLYKYGNGKLVVDTANDTIKFNTVELVDTTDLATKQDILGFTPENTLNKSTSVNTDQASDVKFPSVKSVYDWAIGLFATKSMGAYSFRVNNTNATANSTETTYKALGKQTLSATGLVFTGTTAPSGTANLSYNYTRIGNLVSVTFKLWYSVAGSAITAVSIPFPSDLPTPIQPTGFTSASEKLYLGVGQLSTSKTTISSTLGSCIIRNNSANTGFDAVITGASTNVLTLEGTVTYFTL